MKTFIILSMLVAAAICAPRVLREDVTKNVAEKASWESYKFEENPFRSFTDKQIHALVGVSLRYDHHTIHMLIDNDDHSAVSDLPKEFNAQKQWPECVLPVRNQEHCGSCWAFSASEVLSDRFCIASQGKIKAVLSPQDMVSCNTDNNGCHGGELDTAWSYLEKTGVVSDECLPYVSGDGKNVPHCPHGECTDSKFQYVKYRAEKSAPLTCATQIKKELVKNGPVQTGFYVYEDFMHYKSGVYEHVHGEQLGGHAIKVVGWGVENGKEHWIAQNSWGPSWGENGFFRIAFGQCLFEENAYAGNAKVSEFTSSHFLFYQ